MKKRMLSLMLAVLMVVCLLPTTALAATLVWPVPGHKNLSQGFYYNNANEYHYGIDISDGSITGATIVAAMGGTVKYVRNCTQHHPGSQHNCYGFGTGVVIIGDDGRAYQYCHMQGGSVPSNVYVGARVEAGQMIGRVGQTGDATGPHLHFGISNGQNYWENNVNPMLETYADGPSVGVEWINEQIQTWDTNCYVYSRATTSVKGTFSSGGITLWDSKGNVVATRDDSVNWTGTYLNVGYNITEEIGVTLTPGTAYKYQLRAVFNGKTYTKEGTVTTTGQAPHTHYYTATVTAPTCTAKGYTTHTCACGNSYVDTYTDALGHAWDNGKVTKQPTEAETGVKTFTCTRCGETKTETIPKLAHEHSYKAIVTAPTCTEKGYTTHTCACGDSYVDTYTDALGHAWDNGKVTKQPMETETGTKTFTCTRCGETKTETIPKLAHEHSYKAIVTAPTCTEKGYTTHTCACGDSYVDTYTDALGHAWDNGKVTKPATETENGVKTFTCTRCGETKTEIIPKLTHEHSYKAVVTAPTCTEKGYTTHTCACGDSYVDSYVLPLGHDWGSGKVTKEPTATENGIKTYICARCGETKTDVIPAGGCPSAGFTDVPGDDNWAHAGIDYCVANGLMSGVGGNLFAPKKTTTRAQIVQILYNLQGEPRVYGSTPFTDLTNDWYQDAILWAYQTGVVAGTSGTTFDPDLPVTREQIAVILMEYTSRVLGLKNLCTPADLSRYPDAGSVSDWAKNAMADAVALGLISGASNGGQTCLEPQGSATREQVATILMEFCKNVKK